MVAVTDTPKTLGVSLSDTSKSLGVSESVTINPVLGVSLSDRFEVSLSDTGKDTKEGYQTTFPQNDEKPPSSSAAEDAKTEPPSGLQIPKSEPAPQPFPQGTATPPPTPAPKVEGGNGQATGSGKTKTKKQPTPKAIWDGTAFTVPDILLTSWRTAYPGVDVTAEINKAAAWCVSNPRNAPKSAYGRFLNGWMGRAKPTPCDDPDDGYSVDPKLIAMIEEGIERERMGLEVV